MDLFNSMRVSATGLTASRTKVNVISENLANAETTKTKDGGPYKRKMVLLNENNLDLPPQDTFRNILKKKRAGREMTIIKKSDFDILHEEKAKKNLKKDFAGVEVTDIIESQEDFRLVYNPSHPHADPVTGYVAMPNVDTLTEMADMIVARRAYEANATVISNAKAMISKALEIGR